MRTTGNGYSFVEFDGAKKQIAVLAFLCHIGSLLCMCLTVVLRHARLPNGVENDLMSCRPRTLGNFAHLVGHSAQSSLVESKAVAFGRGELR